MTLILQIALTLASLVFIVLVAYMIPVLIQINREMHKLVESAENLELKLEVLVDNSNDMIMSVSDLSERLNQQLEDVGEVVGTVHSWASRTNRVVSEIASVIEPPVFTLAKHANMFRKGVTTFLHVLFKRHSNSQTKGE